MDIKIENTVENYRERVQRLGLFDCLYRLEQKKKKDKTGKPIDFYSLGILTLLFFFENMLIRNRKIGVKELANYFDKINQGEIQIDHEEFELIARIIIENFRPTGGKRINKEFYNWETRKTEIVEYSYLKASKSDISANAQYYTLAEHGLELVFATKEYYSEFQLSINQLLLRKQLEKGEFAGALRQIDEMQIDVESLEERITKIKYEVQRNILSETTYKRYKELIEDISQRLSRESDEFDELIAFVNQVRDTLSYEIKNEKEIKAYKYILLIQKELGEVHRKHRKLLEKSIELKTTTLQAAQEALYYIGIENFNFKKEIVSRLFSSPLPLHATEILVKPFLFLDKMQKWSPMAVFSPQRIYNKDIEAKSRVFIEAKSESEIHQEKACMQIKFGEIMKLILDTLGDKNEVTLLEIINWVKANEELKWLEEPIFYHFFIILHQKSPLIISTKSDEFEGLLKVAFELLVKDYNELNVTELKEAIDVNGRFRVSNLKITLEREIHDL